MSELLTPSQESWMCELSKGERWTGLHSPKLVPTEVTRLAVIVNVLLESHEVLLRQVNELESRLESMDNAAMGDDL